MNNLRCTFICRDSLIVQFLIAPDLMALLPDKAIQSGELISVVPVLFTQGVNEKQTFAHIKHEYVGLQVYKYDVTIFPPSVST